MIQNRAIVLASVAGGILSLAISLVLGSYIAAAFAALLFCFSMLIWKYGYLLIPYATGAGNIIETRSGYTIPPSRDCVLRKTGNGYQATRFMEIGLYESTIASGKDSRGAILESFERALGSLKHTVKISFMLSSIDLSGYSDEIKSRRGEAEVKRSQLPSNSPDLARVDREIAMWNRQLERISNGERPMEVLCYASTTAFGATRDEALAGSRRQAHEVMTILSSTLSAESRPLSDLDMIRCFEWEYFVPETRGDLIDEVF
jgi:hypothetical protein